MADDDRQRFPAMNIDDRQQPDLRTVSQLVGHEIHTPGIVDVQRLHARLPRYGCLASLLAPRAQLQFFEAIPAVGLVDAELESFALEKDVQATVTPA